MRGAAAQPGLCRSDDAHTHPGLHTPIDPKLDYIARLAVQATGADIGGISLTFQSQIWLQSHVGVGILTADQEFS